MSSKGKVGTFMDGIKAFRTARWKVKMNELQPAIGGFVAPLVTERRFCVRLPLPGDGLPPPGKRCSNDRQNVGDLQFYRKLDR